MYTYIYALCGASELFQNNVLPSILLNHFEHFPTNNLTLLSIFAFPIIILGGGGGVLYLFSVHIQS